MLTHHPSGTNTASQESCDKKVVLGKVTAVHGLRGWVKVYSWTQPMANIFVYPQWWLRFIDGRLEKVKVEETRRQGQGLAIRFDRCQDRDQARYYVNAEILVDANTLPSLKKNEYYWHQLEGLTVLAKNENDAPVNIGKLHHLIDTGANDVMVVRATKDSIDNQERLIPWVEDEVILSVELTGKLLRVEWDPAF